MRSPVFTAAAGAAAILAGAAAAALASVHLLVIVAVLAATAFQVATLRRVSRQPVPLPVVAVVAFNLVGLLGWMWYPAIADQAAVSARLPESNGVYATAGMVFAAASAAVWCGGLLGSRIAPGVSQAPSVVIGETRALVGQAPDRPLLLAAAVPLGVALVARTPAGLIERAHYLDAEGPAALVRAGGMLTPVGIALAAMLFTRREGPRFTPGIVLAGHFALIFALGSRMLAMMPVMLLLAWLINRPDAAAPRRISAVVATAGAALVFLQLPLTMRAHADGAGLAPYLDLLVTEPALLVSINPASILGNILFAVPLAGVVAGEAIPAAWLATSLSPLPGPLTEWGEIRGDLRINAYTPFSGLGELTAHGWGWLVGAMFVMGALIAALQQWNSRLNPRVAALAAVIGLGLTAAPTLSLLQYNLRSGVRSLWYFALLSLALHLLTRRATSNPSRA